ncbi:hypothetical protein C4K05_4376 [Pseudomonas chlororaphis subsp. aureofaciens]|uniref:Uncharacterized protein n=1 Tax=Pseudomonas chlororaphis subsp. aureofaciens TaxID=587851 RepID=A0AAD1E844_9PSED|nr:hypothetical protein C4K14_4633 [Pseudomonas chlororaphis subsp. aureofaciens]AZD93894.1 hypothetical protein C4K13_4486 [Pseudomonas chlororaphis subsp. aureofaciens]AZE00202.1 hypothetical protein C4K12_4344 [Pseudomonas chlororaphis subsp. aureofaciens]AZE18483.1 hypothetical protein C4K09_4031 [Pseudomonas chlororaphis subsp. aureofaciens]AZE24793.1 hypothetical protein C4K08_4375 [Pseudomonas chlororaphis subsp. aureofaciens]
MGDFRFQFITRPLFRVLLFCRSLCFVFKFDLPRIQRAPCLSCPTYKTAFHAEVHFK